MSNSQIAILSVVLLGIIIVLFFVFIILMVRQRRQGQKESGTKLSASDIGESLVNRKRVLTDIIAPDGVDPKPYPYLVLHDAGTDVYIRCFTIDSLPKATKFATTFRPLFNFQNVQTSLFIMPEGEDRTKKKLDRHITMLDGEQSTAYKRGDRNRIRSLQGQISDAEKWVSRIEEGYDKYYKVSFLFILHAFSLKDLNAASDAFYRRAKKNTIELSATYACHPESFLSGAPYGQPAGGIRLMNGRRLVMENKAPLKTHFLSRAATADLFNHISSDFRHKVGVPIGRTFDNRVVMFDPFDETHVHGYGIIFAGKTGSGKTTAIKSMAKRLRNTDSRYRFVFIDSQRRGNRGEYSSLADDLNGVCHQIKHDSQFIINLCEVSDQTEYDELLKTEYRAFHLAAAESVIVNNLLMMIQGEKKDAEFELATYMNRVLSDVVSECFAELNIFDGDVESLYTMKDAVGDDGAITQVRAKKDLPTITMIYKKLLLLYQKKGRHKKAVGLALDALKENVRFLAYAVTPDGVQFLDEKAYLAASAAGGQVACSYGDQTYPVTVIRGSKNYFDGQSTFEFSSECPCTVFDISALPDSERKTARLVVMSFITEVFTKNNAMNYNSDAASKLVVGLDECHENYKFEYMRRSIDNAYRTNRKRHVSTWIGQQQLSDGSEYKEIEEGVLGNTAVMFLFRQPISDKEFLAKHTELNDRQIEDVTRIGPPINRSPDPDEAMEEIRRHVGECCLIDGKIVFMKFDILEASEQYLVASNQHTLEELFQSESA